MKDNKDWKERFDEMWNMKRVKELSKDTNFAIPDFVAIKDFIDQIISERDKEVVKMLENTDVQMSVNGSVSQDEIAMAKFIYKAHIKHIIKKIESAIIPPNSINGILPSETDSATK